MTLTFDLGGHRDCRSYASWYFVRVPSANFGDYMYSFSICRPLGQHGSHWSRDLATLIFDFGGVNGACGWCGSSSSICIQSLKFVGLAIRKIRRTMCVSINGPGDPDLWPFDLETGTRVASKVGNLPSKFGHARPLGSRIISYVRDGRTDGQKQHLLPTTLRVAGIITETLVRCTVEHCNHYWIDQSKAPAVWQHW